jgi:hypothetical protein
MGKDQCNRMEFRFFFSLVLLFVWSKVSTIAGKVKRGKMLFDSIEGKEIVAAVDAPK